MAGLVKNMAKARGDKTSEAELEQRISAVADLLIDGLRYSKVVQFCEGEFGVSKCTAERYIAAANERIKAAFSKDIETETAKAKQRFETLFMLATNAGEYSAATAAQKELVKLMGLAAPEKVEHSADDSITALFASIRRGDKKPA
jgi:hypothetical protein